MEASPSSEIHRLADGVRTEFPIIRIALDDVGRWAFIPLAATDHPVLPLWQDRLEADLWTERTLEALFTLLRDPKWERRGAVLPVIIAALDLGNTASDLLPSWLEMLFRDLRRRKVELEVVLVARHISGGIDAPDQARIHRQITDLLARVMGPSGVGRESVTMLVVGDATGRNAYLSPDDCIVKMTHVLRMIGDPAATSFFLDHVLPAPLLGTGEIANPWGWTHAFSAVDMHRFRLPIDLQHRGRRAKRALALRAPMDATPPKSWQPAITSPDLLTARDLQDGKVVDPPIWSADMFGSSVAVAAPLQTAIDDWELQAKRWIARERASFDERIRAIETEGRIRAERHQEALAEDLGRALRDPAVRGFWRPIDRLIIRLRGEISAAEEQLGPDRDHGLILTPDFIDPLPVAARVRRTMELAVFARPNMVNVVVSLGISAGAVIALGLLAMQPDKDTLVDTALTRLFSAIWGGIERYAVLVRLPEEAWFIIAVTLIFILIGWIIFLLARRRIETLWHREFQVMQAWSLRNRRTLITQRQRAIDRANRRLLNEIKAAALAINTRVHHLQDALSSVAADAPEGRPSRKDPDIIILRPEELDRFSTMLDAKVVSTRKIDAEQILDRFRIGQALPFWIAGLPTDDDDDPTNDYDPLPALVEDPADDSGPWSDEPTLQLEHLLTDFHVRANQAQFRALRLTPNATGGARFESVDVAILPIDVRDRVRQALARAGATMRVVATENPDEAVALRVDRRLTAEEIFGLRATVGDTPKAAPAITEPEAAP